MKTDSQKAAENYERFQYARNRGHEAYVEEHDLCDNFFFNNQWEEEDLAKLTKSGRPALTINKIKPIVLDMTGEFQANRADVKFMPTSRGTPEVATALTQLYLHISNEQDLEDKELTLWLDGIITSRAYYDVRIEFDDNDMGEVRVSVPNPKSVIPDFDSDSKDPADWNEVTLVSYLSIQHIELLYGKKNAKLIENRAPINEDDIDMSLKESTFSGEEYRAFHGDNGAGDETTQRLYLVLERQHRKFENVELFVNSKNGDLRRVPKHWNSTQRASFLEEFPDVSIEKRRRQIVQWTVSCGDVLLHDDISPYDEFTIIPWFPIFRRGKSQGAVISLIDPQRNFNKLRSQELHIVNGTSNSGWKVRRGAMTNMETEDLETRGAATGLVIEWDGDNSDVVERIQPNNIPQGLDRVSEKADRDLKTVSGIDDEARGVARSQTPGKAIQARRDAALISLSPYFESLAWTRKKLAQKILRLVQKFYTEERRFYIMTRDARAEVQEVQVNVPDETTGDVVNDLTLGEYDVVVTPTPLRATEAEEQFNELMQLQEQGWSVPIHIMVEAMSLSRKPEVVEALKAANGMAEPSEQERELAQMMKQLEMEEKKASIAARMAQAKLSEARASKVLSEIELAGNDPEKLDQILLKARELDNRIRQEDEALQIRRQAQQTDALKAGLSDVTENKKIDAQLEQHRSDKQQGANRPESQKPAGGNDE